MRNWIPTFAGMTITTCDCVTVDVHRLLEGEPQLDYCMRRRPEHSRKSGFRVSAGMTEMQLFRLSVPQEDLLMVDNGAK